MAGLFRWLVRITLGLAAIGAVAAGALYWFIARSLPPVSGTVTVAGIERDVEIVRDVHGVPRILAQTEDDAFFGLGYVHAMDRLWQMDLSRRVVQGRLAERFGERALATDRLMRALDLDGHAARSLDALTPGTRAQLNAYAAGVNARITEIGSPSAGAPEFALFSGELDPWTPADSLAVLKGMAFQISMGSLLNETARGRLALALDPLQMRDLHPEYPGDGIDAVPSGEEAIRPQRQREAPTLKGPDTAPMMRRAAAPLAPDTALGFLGLSEARMAGASSAWAVDGSRTAGRAPLLASDPHLPLTAPSVWHPAQISAPGLNVIGATLPGLPAIAFGRNSEIAWGLTATQLDDMDVFIERLDEDDPTRYIASDGPRAFETRTETVQIAGAAPLDLTLRRTQHGPVVPLDTAGLAGVTPEGHVPALAWTALTDDDTTIEALLSLNRAGSAEEAIAIAGQVIAPALNLLVADGETVGIAVAGRAPLRRFTAPMQGRIPAPGWTDRNDWIGWLPESALPRLIEPKSGAVANANNRIGDAPFPRHLSYDWDAPYRINRIERLLNGREAHSIDSFKAMQADNISGTARALLPLIGAPLWNTISGESDLRARAIEKLRGWNGDMNEHMAEPLIFAAWLHALLPRLVSDELGPLATSFQGPRPLFLERVFKDIDGAARWCDDLETEDMEETCTDIASAALDAALDDLITRYGPDDSAWRWGSAHRAVHRHQTLGDVAKTVLGFRFDLGEYVNITVETGGGDDTLNRGMMAHGGPEPFSNVHGAGFRGVYDFSALERSEFIVATGASGHPLSPYYANLTPLWRLGQYLPMSMDPDTFSPNAVGTLVLKPKETEAAQ